MNVTHPYHAFGLNLLSEIEMPHWTEGKAPWDVTIQWGPVPAELSDAASLREVCWVRPDICLLNYPDMGRLLIESGARITAALAPGGALAGMSALIAGSGMTAVLYQRGQICMHASAVAKDGQAILFTGFSGAGKSTLASALLQRGYDFISDDVSVLQPRGDGAFEVLQSYPSVRLCQDSYRELSPSGHPHPIEPLDDKHRVRPEVGRAPRRAVVTRICQLETRPVLVPQSEPVRGIECVQIIQRNLFRPRLAIAVGNPKRLLETSVALARQMDVRRIIRPPSGFHLDRLCSLATA